MQPCLVVMILRIGILYLFTYRSKIGGSHTDSVLVSQLQTGLTLEFEHSDPARRIRLLLCELLFILSQVYCHIRVLDYKII